jgi:stage V sporulation protein B
MKALLKGSIILTASNLAVRVSGYIYRILMGRMLSTTEFGILNMALPIQYLVIILASSGIAPSIAKFVAEKKEDEKALKLVISSSLVYYSIIGLALGTVFFILSKPIGVYFFGTKEVIFPFKISALAMPFGFLISVYTGVFQGFMRMNYMAAVLIFQQIARIALAVIFTVISATATSAILGSTLGFIVAVPLAFILFWRLDQRLGNPDFKVFKEVFFFSLPVSATSISSFVLAYIDILLLGYFLTPHDVGLYSAASPTSRLVLAFSVALYATLIPSISELRHKRNLKKIRMSIIYSYKISLAVLIPATTLSIIFSEKIISLLFGATYIEAAVPFRILVLGTAFLGIFTVNSGILQGLGKPKVPMRLLGITAGIDVVLNIILIPKLGIVGAAIASTLSFTFVGLLSIFLIIYILKQF